MRKLLNINWKRVSTSTEAMIRSLYWKIRKPRYIVVIGPPGSGKGTVAKELGPSIKAAPLSTGDIFRRERQNKTPLGLRIESYIDSGRLVPDALVIAVIRETLQRREYWNGAVIDGFPRTAMQAKLLDKLLEGWNMGVERAVLLDPQEDVIVSRLSKRLTCSNVTCGRTYHLLAKPPQVPDTCDHCKAALYQRKDDVPEVIQERLSTYRREATPICEHYLQKLTVIQPTEGQTEQEVLSQVIHALGQ